MLVGSVQSITFVVAPGESDPGALPEHVRLERTRYPFECREDGGARLKFNGDLSAYCRICPALQMQNPHCLRTDPERRRQALRGHIVPAVPVRLCVECHGPILHGQGQLCPECAETRREQRDRRQYLKSMHRCAQPECETMVLKQSRFCRRHCKGRTLTVPTAAMATTAIATGGE